MCIRDSNTIKRIIAQFCPRRFILLRNSEIDKNVKGAEFTVMPATLSDITDVKKLVREMAVLKHKINQSSACIFATESEVSQYKNKLTSFAKRLKTLPSESDPDIVAAWFGYETLRQAMTQKFNESICEDR